MALSQHLRLKAYELAGKSQLVYMAFAQALEIIPRQLILNSGLDVTDLMNLLRQAHTKKSGQFMGENAGVDLEGGSVVDTYKSFVWEPEIVKRNAINSAVEAACLILSIDETVKNPESAPPQSGLPGQPGRQ
eukprot:NODE_257_length_12663_cov_0.723655.p11 type:complete len:132 gc:universal NODE_257_length_12663_cov_0.723655:11195-10800(-)